MNTFNLESWCKPKGASKSQPMGLMTFRVSEDAHLKMEQAEDQMTLDAKEAAKHFPSRGYSPYADRGFPTRPMWGDTHLHTANSPDAFAFGNRLSPEEAYRFARGEEVTSSHGERVKLARPLDWLVVSDHSDGMGAMKEIIRGNPNLLKDPTVRGWHQRITQGGDETFKATMEVIIAFTEGKTPEVVLDETCRKGLLHNVFRGGSAAGVGAHLDQLGATDDSGGGVLGLNARIVFEAPIAGDYTIVVSDAGGWATGGYVLDLSAATVTVNAAGTSNIEFAGAINSKTSARNLVINANTGKAVFDGVVEAVVAGGVCVGCVAD